MSLRFSCQVWDDWKGGSLGPMTTGRACLHKEGWEAVKSFPSSFHLEPRASHAPSCLPVSVLLTAKSKPPSLQSKS